jgi:hypothetical protein
MTTKAVAVLWNYVHTNKLWHIVTKCGCESGNTALQLTLTAESMADPATREQLRTVLAYAARCVSSIALVGEGCDAMAQSSEMIDALCHLGSSPHLQSVRFGCSVAPNIAHWSPLLLTLERNEALTTLACPIDAFTTSAMGRLLMARRDLVVTAYIDTIEQLPLLRAATAQIAGNTTTNLHVTVPADSTALQLAKQLRSLPQSDSPAWTEIRLLHCKINQETFDVLHTGCHRAGNNACALFRMDVPRERHGCMACAHEGTSSHPQPPPYTRDASLFNTFVFRSLSKPPSAPPRYAAASTASSTDSRASAPKAAKHTKQPRCVPAVAVPEQFVESCGGDASASPDHTATRDDNDHEENKEQAAAIVQSKASPPAAANALSMVTSTDVMEM